MILNRVQWIFWCVYTSLIFAQPQDTSLFIEWIYPQEQDTVWTDSLQFQGRTQPGAMVSIRQHSVRADSLGHFAVTLKTPVKPGPYPVSVLIQGEKESRSFSHVFLRALLPQIPKEFPEDSVDQAVWDSDSEEYLRSVAFLPKADGLGLLRMQAMTNRFKHEMVDSSQIALRFLSFKELKRLGKYQDPKTCQDFECALALGRLNGLDLVFIGSLNRRGSGYRLEMTGISILQGASIQTVVLETGPDLAELERRRVQIVSQLSERIAKVWVDDETGQQRAMDLYEGTPIEDNILTGHLTREHSPYLIYGTVQVPYGEELRIDPGVTLYFVPGQYGGIQVFGQLIAEGSEEKPIRFLSAARTPRTWDWNRLLIVGNGRSRLSYVEISGSNYGLHVENSSLSLQHARIHDNSLRGMYVRHAQVDIQDADFYGGQIVAVQVGNLGEVRASRTNVYDNRNGYAVMEGGLLELVSGRVYHNDRGLILQSRASLITERIQIDGNQVGIASVQPLKAASFEGLRRNGVDIKEILDASLDRLLTEPSAEQIVRSEKGFLPSIEVGEKNEEPQWTSYGNIQLEGSYSHIKTERNPGPLNLDLLHDTVAPGAKIPNTFEVPGWVANTNIFLMSESSDGRGFELQGNVSSSRWNHWRSDPLMARYWSPQYEITVGDFQRTASPLVLSGMDILGVGYRFHMGKNRAQQPLFSLDGFWGETQEPFKLGEKDPDLYQEYYDSAEVMPQELSGMGRLLFSPYPWIQSEVGVLVSRQNKTDLLVRDDVGQVETRDPLFDAKTGFFSLYMTNARGNLQFSLDLAVGQADTSDVLWQRAIDQVFDQAGLVSPYLSDVRWITQGTGAVARRDSAELSLLVGSDSLTYVQLLDSARTLVGLIEEEHDDLQQQNDGDQLLGFRWGMQSTSGRAALLWQFPQTSLSLSAQYVGWEYYSSGNPSLAQNSRQYQIGISHGFTSFWDLDLNYECSMDHAGSRLSDQKNVLGFGEGTSWGLFRDGDWHAAHLWDEDRTLYSHALSLDQRFRIGPSFELDLKYSMDYQFQYLPTVLEADYSVESGVYLDPYFQAQSGASTLWIDEGFGDTTYVDSSRYARYAALSDDDALAWGYRNALWKHGFQTGLQWRRSRFSLRLGAVLNWQIDASRFTVRHLVKDFDLQDSTWEKLGVLPDGQSWFEHYYPLVMTTKIGFLENRMTVTPGWKSYVQDDQKESEYTVSDEIELTWNRFFSLAIRGKMTRHFIHWDEDSWSLWDPTDSSRYSYYRTDAAGAIVPVASPLATDSEVQGGEDTGGLFKLERTQVRQTETQTDLGLEVVLRFNWNTRAYSEFFLNGYDIRRPDHVEESYRYLRGGATFFYSF